ncbi:hypothetical protein [Rhodococcus sp. HNM0569]|uniref:hypothetical protein n=1 Tax=Rhodococcus sp. HNM0569 TaxID=2716340 RepID=UPI00146F66D5|nr:hypothetical protein [Rhodococcus sp. HNM0569]NLU84696.1 hypothetical protein [Rhodococcus sp. HNM0569]
MIRAQKKKDTTPVKNVREVPAAIRDAAPVVVDTARERADDVAARASEVAALANDAATRAKNSDAAAKVTSLARKGAVATGVGLSDLSLYLGRKALAVGKSGVERAKAVPSARAEASAARDKAERSSTRRRRFVVFGALTLAAVAVGAFVRSRKSEQPPVAPAPPTIADYRKAAGEESSAEQSTQDTPVEKADDDKTSGNGQRARND